jgi:pseudouridine-5'-phosphate glycosidase
VPCGIPRRGHARQLARGGTLTAFIVGEEIRDAQRDARGIVALETSVIGQGLPIPQNVECVARMDRQVRAQGSVPAWIGAIDGSLTVGLTPPQLDRFTEPGAATKVARRDLPLAVAQGELGATTVSATIWAAAKADIRVAATGGIGGVHPGERSDVSADLLELARSPGLLVCSGPKSIIDPVATVERLEELGVVIVGYGTDHLPFFLAREAPVDLEHRADTPAEAAALLHAAGELGTRSTILLCHPIRAEAAMDSAEVDAATREAERRADRARVDGKARTPYLLAALAELTEGRSLGANLALLEDNAALAGAIATSLTQR